MWISSGWLTTRSESSHPLRTDDLSEAEEIWGKFLADPGE